MVRVRGYQKIKTHVEKKKKNPCGTKKPESTRGSVPTTSIIRWISLKVYFLHIGEKRFESSSNRMLCSKALMGKKIFRSDNIIAIN